MKNSNFDQNGITATLLISCPDQKGIVASVSNFIYENSGNIIHADQHTDLEKNIFLQRVEWELNGFKIPREKIADEFQPLAEKFGMNWSLRFSDYIPRMAVLVSKQEHCLNDLLSRQRIGEFSAEIPLIISNHPDLEPIAKSFGVEFYHFPTDENSEFENEKQILEKLAEHKIDLVVLARYMRVLSADFVSHYPNKIINIHHSFLPAFAGGKPYHQAYERGVKIIGATAHYVTAELDAGPIIAQDVFRVSHRDSVKDLIRKGRDLEKIVLGRAVNLHLKNAILVYENKTVVFD
ncbi:formyltetrahydrofolate deformylase [Candidatus Wolfebacteria bacterium]|nr:formyltetrahydrofolate deformylase [Candidatus Wolfebacteria bacterium]